LITLGIIGIVVALTMPTLVASYQEQVLKNQFKKLYSVLSQNLQKTIALDFDGALPECYVAPGGLPVSSGCIDFTEKFMANLNVLKMCSGSALNSGCIPVYTDIKNAPACPGFTMNAINNTNTAFVLNDGSIIMAMGNNIRFFLFDVNGKKGPNKVGHDVFQGAFINDRLPLSPYPRLFNTAQSITGMGTCLTGQDYSAPFKTIDDIYK
jgi:type II secretory pathway pseudopilin PulG